MVCTISRKNLYNQKFPEIKFNLDVNSISTNGVVEIMSELYSKKRVD